MLLAAAKRKLEATTGEGTSVSDAEMAQRLGAQSGAAGAQAGAAQQAGDASRVSLPGKGSKRARKEGNAGGGSEEPAAATFAVPPVMPAARKAGSMRRPKKKERSGG